MKTLSILLLVLFNLISGLSYSQISDTIQADKDAIIRELNEKGDNSNYGNYEYINMHSWTNQGALVVHRSLINFDLSSIPDGSLLTSAELQLFADFNSITYPNGHESLVGSNSCFIHRIVTDWDEYLVTWNEQPAITTLNQVEIPQSDDSLQNYEIDVTSLVQNMLDDTANSFGFLIRQQHEIPYRRMVFASKDNLDQTLWPKLIVNYQSSIISDNIKKPNQISIYPNPTDSWINVDFGTSENKVYTLKLFDPQGILVKEIEHKSSAVARIDMSNLSRGSYLLQVIDGYQIYAVKKIIVE